MKKNKYPIHPDFKRWANTNPPIHRAILPVMQKVIRSLEKKETSSDKLTVTNVTIAVAKGQKIKALLYSPVGIGDDAPCLVYYHGGGFVFPAAPHHYSLVREYSPGARCHVLLVDYRLAPRYPFPTAPKDCYAAYCWLISHAKKFSIDTNRVAVGGDSAGGQLAAVVSLMARDHPQVMPCGQLMIYPVTGRGVVTESMQQFDDTPMCNSRDVKKYDKLYIQSPIRGKQEYASPLDAGSLEGMPPTYIETAEFDCLRDEGKLFAERLKQAGVSVEYHQTKGTIHGFDIVLESPIVRDCVDKRIRFLRTVFEQ